jgi:nitric oxide reductase large subunit
LDGVQQVTAAHEMLHAAYRRLNSSERTKVDAMLTDYYEHSLTDQRIKDTIAAYKKSEPNDVVNEMHSVFGTEVANLPTPLEDYYKQYFTNRATVTGFTASYQAEFTSRQTLIAQYDAQLKALKQQIDTSNDELTKQNTTLDAQAKRMQTERSSGQIAAYNSEVASYNQAADSYNALLGATKAMINQYNDIVEKRNAVALEEQQLSQELSASSLPSSQ